jgi:hypothetical protein
MRFGSDIDWVWRARDAGLRSQLIEEVLLLRRIHRANSSIARAAFMSGLPKAAYRSIRRKRLSVAFAALE